MFIFENGIVISWGAPINPTLLIALSENVVLVRLRVKNWELSHDFHWYIANAFVLLAFCHVEPDTISTVSSAHKIREY